MNYKLSLLFILSLSQAIYAASSYPIKLQDVVRESDKVAVFEVVEIEYVKKEMMFNATHETKGDATYISRVLLTKYTVTVEQPIKETNFQDTYEIYSDGGIDVEADVRVESSVGFELKKGENVLVMLEYDDANDIYMPLYHNSTVFKMTQNNNETIFIPYSGTVYYKKETDIDELISGNKKFDENMIIEKITLETIIGLLHE